MTTSTDQIGLALSEGLLIDKIVLANGWKYFEVEHVQLTQVPGVYMVQYRYRDEPIRVLITGSEVTHLVFKGGTE